MMRIMKGIAAGVITWLALATTAIAGDDGLEKRAEFDAGPLTSRWIVTLGGSISSFDTRMAWSPQRGGGAFIPVEETLGLDSSDESFRLAAEYRFDRRHSIRMNATDFSRQSSKIIDDEISWGGYFFRAFGQVETELGVSIVSLKYLYDFSDSGRLNAGFSLGLSTFSIDASLAGEARLQDHEGSEWVEGIVEGTSLIAPVPLIGFFIDYAVTPEWIVRFAAEIIDLDVGGHSGRVLQTGLALEYFLTDSFGLGLELTGLNIEYSAEQDGEQFGANYGVKSIGAFLVLSF